MTDLEKAARQALDALENEWFWPTPRFAIDAIDALRAALAQQQAEPVAVLAEREACANIAREVGTNTLPEDFALDRCYEIESAIRARGQQAEPHKPAIDADNGQSMTQAKPVVDKALTNTEPQVDKEQAKPGVESMLRAGKFCDANCTAIDHHADCPIGNHSY